jgi:hypothetical protein
MKGKARKARAGHEAKKSKYARFERINRRLLAYSATAGAALAIAGPPDAAKAGIVYDHGFSGPFTLSESNRWVDLDGHGVAFSFDRSHAIIFGGVTQSIIPAGRHARWMGGWTVRCLSTGERIGTTNPGGWAPLEISYGVLAHRDINSLSFGPFLGARGYIGVKFDNPVGPSPLFGWIDFEASADAWTGTVYGWAYEDSGGPILAGATGVPEPGSLAALAAGVATAAAAAFYTRRKRAA